MTPKQRREIGNAILADVTVKLGRPIREIDLEPARLWDASSRTEASCRIVGFSRPQIRAVPPETSDMALAVFAHECGHLFHDHPGGHFMDLLLPSVTGAEYEATAWGFDAIKRHGGTVTADVETAIRSMLATYIVRDERNKTTIPAEAQAFLDAGPIKPPEFYEEKAKCQPSPSARQSHSASTPSTIGAALALG